MFFVVDTKGLLIVSLALCDLKKNFGPLKILSKN